MKNFNSSSVASSVTLGINSIGTLVSRLEYLLNVEQEALLSNQLETLKSTAVEKMQILALLAKLSDRVLHTDISENDQEILRAIKIKLETNASAVSNKLEAIRQVVSTVELATEEAESDGTYQIKNSPGY